MTTGERMKARRKELGLSAEKVAERLGVSAATVYRYENGDIEKLPSDILSPLAEILHTTCAYLMDWDTADTSLPPSLEPYRPKSQMPLLGRVAAGLPMYAEENIEGYIANDFTDGENYYALRVFGDSMNAAGIDPGDIVVVRQQNDVEEHEIGVILVNGNDATIKYFRQQGSMAILSPRSTNPAHQVQIYDIRETTVRIIGRVVQVRKNL